jgi:hypothetical protein
VKHTLMISPLQSHYKDPRAHDWQRTFDAAITSASNMTTQEALLGIVCNAGKIANSLHGTFPETERFGVLNFGGEPS